MTAAALRAMAEDAGDVVRHRPSGEEWLVASADPENDEIEWAGWPNGKARLSDCDIVRQCSDEEHAREVQRWNDSPHDDGRRSNVLRRHPRREGHPR